MTSYCLLVALVTLLQKGVCTAALGTIDNCSHQSCPKYEPFCTPIGCVTSCPTNDFVNGSTCVTSCDHMFVGKNRQCLNECPSGHLIQEKTVNNAGNYRLDRYCVDSCDQVIYNRTCFSVCPKHAMFVNDGYCVVKCPPDKNIVRRFPEDKEHLRCSEDCGAGVFQDNICVAYCTSYRYVFNQTCVKECPKEAPLLFNDTGRETCRSECPSFRGCPTYNQNGTCVFCYLEHEFIYNNSCVSVCPDDEPFIIQPRPTTNCPSLGYRGGKFCVRKCPDKSFISGTRCVPDCPIDTRTVLNQVCTTSCSEEYPIGVLRPNLNWQNFNLFYRLSMFFNCESSCPDVDKCLCSTDRPLLYNNSCISECPPDVILVKQLAFTLACVPACDADEFVFNNTCLKTCPVPKYKYNNSCFDHCPTGYALDLRTAHTGQDMCVDVCDEYIFNNTNCVTRCPNGHQYTFNKTCLESCWTRYVDTSSLTCYDQCPSDRYLFNSSECVSQCPASHNYIYNRTCTDVCPSEAPFKKVKTTFINYSFLIENECLTNCGRFVHVFNDTNCVERCPHSHNYTDNETCVEFCESRYVEPIQLKCYNQCPSDRFLFNNSECISLCPASHNYIYNGTCVDKCPNQYIWVQHPWGQEHPYNRCMDVCPKHMFILNSQTCVDRCPHVNFKSKCYDACPSEASFLEQGINCKEYCSQYVSNKTCVSDCPKEEQFVFNKRCFNKCPPGTMITNTHYFKSLTDCSDKCPSDKVNLNGTCIYKFECKDPNIIFKDECLVECPQQYVWIGTCTPTIVFCILTTLCWTALLALIMKQRNQSRNLIQLIWFSFCYKKTKSFDDPRFRNASDRRQTQELQVNSYENDDDDVPSSQFGDTTTHTANVDAILGIEEVCIEGLNTCDDETIL